MWKERLDDMSVTCITWYTLNDGSLRRVARTDVPKNKVIQFMPAKGDTVVTPGETWEVIGRKADLTNNTLEIYLTKR
jgi:hypothetical protein